MAHHISVMAIAGLALSLGASALPTRDPVLQTMVDRITAQTIVQPQQLAAWDANIDYCLSVLKPDYSFSDIDYTFQQPAIWPAYNHTKRAEWMTAALISPGSKYYNNSAFLDTTLHVLDWWLVNGPNSKQDNWWWWTIGVPVTLGITTNVLQPYMAPNQTAAANVQLLKANPAGYTACNLIWTCEGTVYRGLLTNNMTAVQLGLNLSFATISYATGENEGIKADASFFQHGAQLYSGGYGMSYALGIAMFLSWTAGTPLGIPDTDPRVEVFSHLMLDGSLRMIRYGVPPEGTVYSPGLWDISVVGRDISRPYGSNWANQAGVQVQFSPALIAGVGGPRADEFAGYGALLNGSATMEQTVNLTVASIAYHQADYILHSSSVGSYAGPANGSALGWQASVRMASTRTLRCECINGENLHGLHLSDGALYLLTHGYEYVDTFPAWDWMKLPGTTVLPYAVPWSCGGGGTTSFVGGAATGIGAASLGLAGLASAVQDYQAANNEGLTMRKSVFFYPDLYVALGSNITASVNRTKLNAWTGVAQRRLATGVFTSTQGTASPLPDNTNTSLPASTWWVWEGGIGYVFPFAAPSASSTGLRGANSGSAAAAVPTVFVSNLISNGTWQEIGAESGNVSVALLTLWLEHAAPVVGGSYSYVVVPNIGLNDFVNVANTLIIPASAGGLGIVRNDANAQAVLHGGLGALQAAVFALDVPTEGSSTVSTAASGSSVINGGAGWNVTATSVGSFILQNTGPQGQAPTSLALTAAQPGQPGSWSFEVTIDRTFTPGPGSPGPGSCVANGFSLPTAPGDGSSVTVGCQLA